MSRQDTATPAAKDPAVRFRRRSQGTALQGTRVGANMTLCSTQHFGIGDQGEGYDSGLYTRAALRVVAWDLVHVSQRSR